MNFRIALLFSIGLLLFFGCNKPEKQNTVNEINLGVIGVKPLKDNDSTYQPTFKKIYKIDLNSNKLLVIENPVKNSPLQRQKISEYHFNFSTNRVIGNFIDFAKKTKSITLLDFSRDSDTDNYTKCPTENSSRKIIYIDFIRGKNSRRYILENQFAAPELRQLYSLLFDNIKTSKLTDKTNTLKINADSFYSNKAKYFKIKFETPPPPPAKKQLNTTLP